MVRPFAILFALATLFGTVPTAHAVTYRFGDECADSGELFDDADFYAHTRAFLDESLATGLANLRGTNPRIADRLARRLRRTKTIFLRCHDLRDLSLGSSFIAGYRHRFLGRHQIELGTVGELVSDLSVPALRANAERFAGAVGFAARVQYYRNTLFHEFLHFAGVRNQSRAAHNAISGHDFDVERDLVYACAYAAFPTNYDYIIDAEKALATCRNAR